MAVITHSLREGEAWIDEAQASVRSVATKHTQEIEAIAAAATEELRAELELHHSRCQQQGLPLRITAQRGV